MCLVNIFTKLIEYIHYQVKDIWLLTYAMYLKLK